jgi:hypothetical protein
MTYARRLVGLNSMADRAGEPRGNFVAPQGGVPPYCILHYALMHDDNDQTNRPQGLRIRSDAMRNEFERRIENALTGPGMHGIRLHGYMQAYGVWAYPVNENAEEGEAIARLLWEEMRAAGNVPPPVPPARPPHPAIPPDWRRGDVLYIHYPTNDGLKFAGTVVDVPGVPPAAWP